jgi:serine protease
MNAEWKERRDYVCPPKRSRPPINVSDTQTAPEFSGFLIIRLLRGVVSTRASTLDALVRLFKLGGLATLLKRYNLTSRRLITSVSIEQLLRMEDRARRSEFPPLHSLASYWRLDARGLRVPLEQVLAELRELHEVDFAYREQSVTDPVNAADDTFAATQNYLDAAPTGINARWAWTQASGDGTGMHFVDLEQGWFLGHEDLPGPALIFNNNRDGVGTYVGNHGTSVLGEVTGVDNTRGVVGIAPALASVRVVSHFEAAGGTALHVADAIVAAVAAVPAPHALLLEVQRGALLLPTESDDGDFDAIRLAVASGVIVIEAGGNGGNDLDTWTDTGGHQRLNRASADFRDSGAILVGAASSATPHERLGFSNFGSRVDCYGWGENIVSAGYGDLSAVAGNNTTYTSVFGGTSGASPIITGAALLVQGLYRAATGSLLSPGQMRSILADPATGTAQGVTVAGAIGVMPDLQQVVQNSLGLVTDVYLRDALGDSGVVPSTGFVSVSPDVIVRTALVADPNASFGEGSGTENDDTLGDVIEHGQDNFIYVRMRNRGTAPATATTAMVYWSEVATLVTPNMWVNIGTTAPIAVPVGDTLAVTGPLTWPKAGLPPVGDHACFVAVLDDPRDPAPPIPPSIPAFDWNAFINFIRNQNNVAWRNFDVVEVLPDPSADPAVMDFLIVGAPDRAREFHFELLQQLPEGAKVWLEVPLAMMAVLPRDAFGRISIDRKAGRARLAVPFVRSLPLCDVRLGADARHRCRLVVQGGKGLARGLHRVALRQIYQDVEVGRVTLGLRVKTKREQKRRRPLKRKR